VHIAISGDAVAAQGVWRQRGLRRSGPVRGPRRRCVNSETRTTARRLAAYCHGWFEKAATACGWAQAVMACEENVPASGAGEAA
jgi:hypothetical protein